MSFEVIELQESTAEAVGKGLTDSDKEELENALELAKSVCARIQRKVAYAGNIHDAGVDVIRACNEMVREAFNA